MNKKIFENARFTPKGDIEANWKKATGFIPLDREVIIYKPDQEHLTARIKIGDGVTPVQDLPFITELNGIATEDWVRQYINTTIDTLPQPSIANYEQNDPTAADYIKNRPFYDMSTCIAIPYKSASSIGGNYVYFSLEDEHMTLLRDNIDDVLVYIHFNENQGYGIGKFSTKYTKYAIEFPPIETNISGMKVYIPSSYSRWFESAEIFIEKLDCKQLDEKFIPDTIARVKDSVSKEQFDESLALVVSKEELSELAEYMASSFTEENRKQDDKIAEFEDKLNNDRITYITFQITEDNTEINFKALPGATKVDWGDDTVNTELAHIYAHTGTYECKIYDLTEIAFSDYGLPQPDHWVQGRTNVTDCKIGKTVTGIGDGAFFCFNNLVKITIPDSVMSIGEWAFWDCDSLTSIVIPDSVRSIGEHAFYGCSNLTSVVIGNGVTSIGDDAFRNCSSLTSVVIPDSVISIGDSAFFQCRSLASVTIGNSVTSIGDYAFDGCNSLTSINIPNGITRVGSGAFSTCSNLSDIYITNLTTWCEDGSIVRNIVSAAKKHNLYLNNKLVTKLLIPDSVSKIDSRVFYNCESIVEVTISDKVKSIGTEAFRLCTNLTKIELGKNVTAIAPVAFSNCTSLAEIIFHNIVPIKLMSGAPEFLGISPTHIYVPKGCLDVYRAEWAASGATEAIINALVESKDDREAYLSDITEEVKALAPIAKSGNISDLQFDWDMMFVFDGGDAGSHKPIALVGTTKLI